jgi:quinolinate synthase
MNSLSSLLKVCHQLPDKKDILMAYEAERFKLQTPNGKSVADVGCEPILHMRQFQVYSGEIFNLSLTYCILGF